MDGIVNVNKPKGWSSFKVADTLKKISGSRRAGHAGTLDLEAKGVLIILLGEACKAFELFMKGNKTYEAVVELGWKSTTLDSGGEIEKIEDVEFQKEEIEETLKEFKGTYIHEVPQYSAKKYHGKTFYSIKRNGKIPPKRIQETRIFDIRLMQYTSPLVKFAVTCSSGTYIRTLSVDIARKLGTEGYLKDLVRTDVNGFRLEEAVQPEEKDWYRGFRDINDAMLNFPHIIVDSKSACGIPYGICFTANDIIEVSGKTEENTFGVYSPDFKLLALAEKVNGSFKLRRVFNWK